MKVLHLPTSVGGGSWGLAQGEKEIGLYSKVLIDYENWLDYPYDFSMELQKRSKVGQVVKKIETFFKVRSAYDIFHFNFGSSLIDIQKYGIHLIDLPFYRGKKIMTYNGCDARQKYPTINRVSFAPCYDEKCYSGMCNSGLMDIRRQKRIQQVSKNVDHIFALNPDLMYFLPPDKTTFLPYAIAGWKEIITQKYAIDAKIKIVHSPTNRAAKGSSYILAALENLQRKYPNIEVEIIEHLPYAQALKKYQEAHIVIDQVLIGWYGGFGVEVMKMGKPLAVFIRDEDLKFIPAKMAKDLKESIININPFNIEETLEKYIQNTDLLCEKSKSAVEYVHKWHDPVNVATITKQVYES